MPYPEGESASDVPGRSLERCGLLNGIADDLFFSKQSGIRRDAAVRLHALFSEITGVGDTAGRRHGSRDTILPTGKALCPEDAATCILDFARTSQFLKGIHAALLAAQKRFSQRPIEILYAGCGPFAALAIPLATQFSAADIRFTLLDIHHESLESAQCLFQAFGLSTFVRHYVQGDATSYVHPSHEPLHMVITETMQRALVKEPQVAISLNLAPQLCPGGVLIPEKISIDACLFDLDKEFSTPSASDEVVSLPENSDARRVRIELGRILEITAENACQMAMHRQNVLPTPDRFPAVVLDVPRDANKNFHVMLRTIITVFESVVLQEYDSGLTYPAILHELGSVRNGTRIEFQYIFDNNPRFTCRWVDLG